MLDTEQPGIQRPLVTLQAQLRHQPMHGAVGEGDPRPRHRHTDVHAHGHPVQQREGGLQRPVVLTSVQHHLEVTQELAQHWGRRPRRG